MLYEVITDVRRPAEPPAADSAGAAAPEPLARPARLTGGTTHWRLVPLPHGLAWRPLTPKKNNPSFAPSTPEAEVDSFRLVLPEDGVDPPGWTCRVRIPGYAAAAGDLLLAPLDPFEDPHVRNNFV